MTEQTDTEKSGSSIPHNVGDLVLVKWNDGMVYFAKIKRIDHRQRKCVVVFDDKSTDEADFSQIHSVDETTTDIICIKCKHDDSDAPNEIVLCDSCGIGFHQHCHVPPIPASALELDQPWQCTYCQKKLKNPYLTESIDVIQTLFDEGEVEEKEEEEEEMDEEEEVDEYVGGAEEEVRKIGHEQGVKQHMLLQTGAQYKYTSATSLHSHSGPGRKRKGRRASEVSISRTVTPRMKSPDVFPRLKMGRGSGKRRRGEHGGVGSKRRRTSTVQTHTVSVKQIPLPMPTRKMPQAKAYVSSSDDESEEETAMGSPEIEPIATSEQPRSLRVSLTISPSMDSSPITLSHRPSSPPTLPPPGPPPMENVATSSPAPPSSENSFVTSTSHQHSPIQSPHLPEFDTSQALNLKSPVVVEQQQPEDSLPSPPMQDHSSHLSDDVFSDVSTGCDKPSSAPPQPLNNDKAGTTITSPSLPDDILSDTTDSRVHENYITPAPPPLQSREKDRETVDTPSQKEATSPPAKGAPLLAEPHASTQLAPNTSQQSSVVVSQQPARESLVIVAPVTQLKPVKHRRTSVIQDTSPPPLSSSSLSSSSSSSSSSVPPPARPTHSSTSGHHLPALVSTTPTAAPTSKLSSVGPVPSKVVQQSPTSSRLPVIPASSQTKQQAPAQVMVVRPPPPPPPPRTPPAVAAEAGISRAMHTSLHHAPAQKSSIHAKVYYPQGQAPSHPPSLSQPQPAHPHSQPQHAHPHSQPQHAHPHSQPQHAHPHSQPQLAHPHSQPQHAHPHSQPQLAHLHSQPRPSHPRSHLQPQPTHPHPQPQPHSQVWPHSHTIIQPPPLRGHGAQGNNHSYIKDSIQATRPRRMSKDSPDSGVGTEFYHSPPVERGGVRPPSNIVSPGTGLVPQHHRAVITSGTQPSPMVSVILTPTTISATGEVATVYTLVPASHIGGGRGPVVTYTTSPSPSPKEVVMNSTPTAVELPRIRHHQQMGKALMSTAPVAVNNPSTPRSPVLYTPAQQTGPISCGVPASALVSVGHTQGGVVIVDSLPAQEIPKVPQREVVFCQQPLNSNGNATKSYAIVNTVPSGTPPPLPPPPLPPPPPLASKHPPLQLHEPRQVAVNGIPSQAHHPNRPPPPYQHPRQIHHFTDPTPPASTFTHRTVGSGPVIQDEISAHRGRTQHVMVDFGPDQFHDETSSELADHLRKLSSRYGKEFESLGREKLMEIFHEAWKKFQSNGRKYEAFTKQQKTTRPSSLEVHPSPPSTTPASSIVITPTQRTRPVIRGQQLIQTVPVQPAPVPATSTLPTARPSLPPLAPATSAVDYVYAYATPEPLRQQPVIVPTGNTNQANVINLTDIPPPPLSSSSTSGQQSRFQQIQTSGVFVPPPSPNEQRQQTAHGLAVVTSSTPATVVRSPHQRLLKPKPSTQSSVPAGHTRGSSTSSTSSLSSSSSSSSVVLIQRPIVAPSEQDIALAAAAAAHQPRSSAATVGTATSVVVRTPSGSSVGSRRRSSSSNNMKQSRVCALCGKDATYLCSGCHTEWYCSRDCQLKAWDYHADHCKA